MKILLLIVLGLTALIANAADWIEIGKSDRWVLSYDKQSIVGEDKYRSVLTRFDYINPQSTESGKTYNSKQDRIIIECKNRKFLIQYSTKYDNAFSTEVETKEFREADYTELFAESADKAVHSAVCTALQ